MKLAILNDTHFGARNDAEIFYEYQKKFIDEIFLPNIKNVDRIVHLGDVFDRRKYINFKTLNFFRENFFEKIKDFQYYQLLGNHDVFYKNTNSINSPTQLIGWYDNIHIIDNILTEELDSSVLIYVPWINSENEESIFKVLNQYKKSTKPVYVFGHFEINGFNYGYAISNDGYEQSIFSEFTKIYSGHYHAKQRYNNIEYLGSQFEFTWIDYGQEKGFHIFDTNTGELEFYKNPFRKFIMINYNDNEYNIPNDLMNCYVKVIVKKKTNQFLFDIFLDKIYKQNPYSVMIIDEYIQSDNANISLEETQSKSTIDILKDYVLELDFDKKDDIIKEINNLYQQSMNMEINE